MNDCQHEYYDLPGLTHHVEETDQGRVFFYCKKCLLLTHRELDGSLITWHDKNEWEG